MKADLDLTLQASVSCGSRDYQALALVFSHTPSAHLGKLTSRRCTSTLPFAGRYRLIDFALSNCANSGIGSVGVIAQYQPCSLRDHLVHGRPWGLDRCQGGFALLLPYETQTGMGWYKGTADAVYQNWEFISRHQADRVFILDGSEVHMMDLSSLAVQHCKVQADLTVAAVPIAGKAASRYHTLVVDREGWVRALALPGASRPGPLAAMGAVLFSTEALSCRLRGDAQQPDSAHDLFHDVIPAMIKAGDRVMAFQHTGYWSSLQSVRDYWQASMDLVRGNPDLNLQNGDWPIYTQSEARPPAHVAGGSMVSCSLISEGCVLDGSVESSVLSPGVHVAAGAVVRNAVVMHDTIIEERALVENAILDANVIIGPQARVGELYRHAPTLSGSLSAPLTVVEQGTRVPTRSTIRPGPPSSDWGLPDRRDSPAQLLKPRPELVVGTMAIRDR